MSNQNVAAVLYTINLESIARFYGQVAGMSATLVPNASITLPLLGACVTEDEMVNSPTIAPRIRRALAALADALASGKESGPSFPVD